MNNFKVGDWVKIKDSVWDYCNWEADGFKKDAPEKVVDTDGEYVYIRKGHQRYCIHYTNIEKVEMKPEETKYATIPFSVEAWEKWKVDERTKVFYKSIPVTQLTMFDCKGGFVAAGVMWVDYGKELVKFHVDDFKNMIIHAPVTTKRIPFNPELKDAKVFYGNTELIDWHQMKSGVVCGTRELNDGFNGQDTNLYHPNDLTMEIEE